MVAVQTDLHARFDTHIVGALGITDIDGSGAKTLVDAGYWHLTITESRSAGGGALCTAVNAIIGATAHAVQLTFNAATLKYTLASSGTNFTYSIGQVLANYLGLATTGSGANSYTSTFRPYGVIRPLNSLDSSASTANNPFGGMSMVSDDYSPVSAVRAQVADDGVSQYAISVITLPKYRAFTFPCERDTPLYDGGTYSSGKGHAMMTRNATGTMPWAWQDFFNLVRCEAFFAFASQTSPISAPTADIYKMQPQTGTFDQAARRRRLPDYGLWDVSMVALLVGSQ